MTRDRKCRNVIFSCYDISIGESFRDSNKQILDKAIFNVFTMTEINPVEQKNSTTLKVANKLKEMTRQYVCYRHLKP